MYVELDHILPLLVPVQLHHLPPLCPFLPTITICIWNKNFKKKSPNNLKLDQVMSIKRDSPHVLASFLLKNSDDVGLSARHSPRGRPSNRLTFYDPNSASKGWRQRSTVHWLIDWSKSVAYSKLFFELSRMPTQWSIYIYHHMHICTNKCFSTQII